MKKKYNLRKIKARRSYTPEEISNLLDIHIQTVRDWHRNGLKPLKENTSPYLFIGEEIKRFLKEKQDALRVKLKDGEFYCLSCKKAVKPLKFKAIKREIKIGNNKDSFIFKAKRPICSKTLNRFSSYQDAFSKNESLNLDGNTHKTKKPSKDFGNLSIFDQKE